MNGIYFEDIHRATEEYPYLDFKMENINYIAHFHEEIELIFVVEGEVSVVLDNEEYRLSQNDLCLIMPGEIHSLSSLTPSRLYILKLLTGPYPGRHGFLSVRLDTPVIEAGHPLHAAFLDSILTIREEDEQKKEGYEYAVRREVCNLTVQLLRGMGHTVMEGAEKKRMTKRLLLLKGVNEYIKERYAEPISLEEIAGACGYSKYYFAHYFREVTGMCFLEYLTLYRLDRAVALMKLSAESITNIALLCGFNTLRSFHRSFKKHFGSAPTEYLRAEGIGVAETL